MPSGVPVGPPEVPVVPATVDVPVRQLPWLPVVVILLVLVGLALLSLRRSFSYAPRVALSSRILKGDSAQVAFQYDVSALKADSVRLDFGDGTSQWLSKHHRYTVHEYPFPDLYRARLIADNRPMTEVMVHTATRDWVGRIVQHDLFYPIVASFRQTGYLYAPPEWVQQSGADTSRPYWTFYRYMRDFGVSGDDFSAEVRVKNSESEGGIGCYDVNLEIIGEKGDIRIEFLQPGCTVWTDLTVSEVKLDGKMVDLSALGQRFSTWKRVQVQVKNHQMRLLVEGKLIYPPVQFRQPLGSIKGFGIGFKGSGAVDYLQLYNAAHDRVYADEFDQ